MYCECFGFREKPFNITPDPSFIYFSRTHKEAFAHLLYGIDNHVGFIEITGEVGTGKTTVLRTLLSQLDGKNYRTALIFNPCLSSAGLMQGINREYGLPYKGLDNEELLEVLNQFLLRQNAEGNTVVLVIDEAQNLKQDVLEQIRLISNLETERDKLIQIILSGQPELEQLLKRSDLRQLNQRIAVRYHLSHMDFEDTGDYIRHRITVAGGKNRVGFSSGAVKGIYRFSGGVPRLINIACDRSLLAGYTAGQEEITSGMVALAVKDIRKNGKKHATRPRFYLAGAILLALVLVSAVFGIYRFIPGVSAVSDSEAGLFHRQYVQTAATERVFPEILRGVRAGMSESSSAVQAFNALAVLWKAAPVSGSIPAGKFMDLDSLASTRSLRISRFDGNLGALLRMNMPAILELTLPGIGGKRYLALTGADSGRLTISPPIAGRNYITPGELDKVWSGRAYLVWKNYLEIPNGLKTGSKGEQVGRLQALLRDAGFYRGIATGVYDGPTIASIENFQSAGGLETDGIAGNNTLMLLYRSAGGYFVPELVKKGGKREK
jgi:general secretion pathway protein A